MRSTLVINVCLLLKYYGARALPHLVESPWSGTVGAPAHYRPSCSASIPNFHPLMFVSVLSLYR